MIQYLKINQPEKSKPASQYPGSAAHLTQYRTCCKETLQGSYSFFF